MNTNLHVILSLFATSSRLQRKRAYLTVASIAWGTVAILLLLAFGEGLKRQMDKNRRSTGENLAVMWMGETSKAWKGMPPGRPIRLRIDDLELVRRRMGRPKRWWARSSPGAPRSATAARPSTAASSARTGSTATRAS